MAAATATPWTQSSDDEEVPAEAAPAAEAPATAAPAAPTAKRSKRNHTPHGAIGGAIYRVLETLTEMADEGHVDTLAHTKLADALKQAWGTADAVAEGAAYTLGIELVADNPFLLYDLSIAETFRFELYTPKFLRKLLRERRRYERAYREKNKPTPDPEWIHGMLDFYIRAYDDPKTTAMVDLLDDRQLRDPLRRQMIFLLAEHSTPKFDLVPHMLRYMHKQGMTAARLCPTCTCDCACAGGLDADSFYCACCAEEWGEALLDTDPRFLPWLAPNTDPSERARRWRTAYEPESDSE